MAVTVIDPPPWLTRAAVLRRTAARSLLGLVALGLVAFGIFGLVEARYRFIPAC